MNGIGKTGLPNNRDSISIWRVYLPTDVDRSEYIKTCYLTGTVSLINDGGETVHRVKVGKFSIQLIKFPADKNSFGSEVVCVSAPYSAKLYVIDVYTSSSEYCDQDENQIRLYKNSDSGGFAELKIDGNGKILLSVDSEDQADITVSVTNKDRAGTFNLNVNGELNVVNDGNTLIQTTNEIKLEHLQDENSTNVSITKDLVNVITKKLVVNSDDEPMLLGNKTADLIVEILDQLAKESAGPYPLLGQSIYATIKSKIEEIKSKKSFLD